MKFEDAARLSSYISKSYSKDIFKLLTNYRDISASEAASRLGLHIQTVQDFLEAMQEFSILRKNEATERKRPYFRYRLDASKISIEIDLKNELKPEKNHKLEEIGLRENSTKNVRFSLARNKKFYSNVSIWAGKGRERTERKINLTIAQGMFLFHLPLPKEAPLKFEEIRIKAGVEINQKQEIIDLVEELIQLKVIRIEA